MVSIQLKSFYFFLINNDLLIINFKGKPGPIGPYGPAGKVGEKVQYVLILFKLIFNYCITETIKFDIYLTNMFNISD